MSSLARILLVDDNPKYLSDVLPTYGYEVIVAIDGFQALKTLSSNDNKFDIILLDVMMPNMDGWTTLKSIRENEKTKLVPVIMITALDKEQQQVSGLRFGADDYIVKPFTLPNLLARVEALLRRSKWNKEQPCSQMNLNFVGDDPIDDLTVREKEVLKLVAHGSNNQEIAEKLFIREVTVKTHLNNVFKKLNVTNRTQAVLLAMQLKMI